MVELDALIDKKLSEQELFEALYKIVIPAGKARYVGTLLRDAAHTRPDMCALVFRDTTISYAQLYKQAVAVSAVVTKHGVKPGDRVLLFFENSIEFYAAYFGILHTGAVVAPLNTFLKEPELAHIVHDAQPALMISSFELAPVVRAMPIDNIPTVITEHDFPAYDASMSHEIYTPDTDALNVLLYTSGTTGLPKGAMLSSRNIMVNVVQGLARFGLLHEERVLAILPLFHSFAQNTCIWAPFLVGCTVIVVPKIDRRYLLEGLQLRPTIFLGVPALFGLLCIMKNAPIDSINYFISGGDALPDSIRSGFALIYRRKICSGYGLTETSPLLAVDLDDVCAATNTVGKPVMGLTVSLRDREGRQVPEGSIGQLWIGGENVMLGYYNEPEMTQKTIVNGFLSTGDLAYLDAQGKLVISGRYKDLIINKGQNIYPQEIENVIQGFPGVIRVAVIGQKDESVGEVPIAYVQLRSMDPGIEGALKDLCTNSLAPYKVPKEFICTASELPITATGKIDKKTLARKV